VQIQAHTWHDVTRILRRRWWQLAVPLAAGTLIGVVAYRSVPSRYQAETVIMLVQQDVPETYVKALVGGAANDRLRAVTEQIQSRSSIETIIREFNLYPAERSAEIDDERVDRVRTSIDVKLEGNDSLFRLSYVHANPVVAQRVANRLGALYMAGKQDDRERAVQGTTRILDTQLQDAKQRLMAHEKRLADYKRQHAGELPSQFQANLQVVQTAQLELHSTLDSISRAHERRQAVERQLSNERMLLESSDASPKGPDTLPSSPLVIQLDAARLKLAELKRTYTGNHPDVLEAEEQVRELEARVAEEGSRLPGPAPDKPLSAEEQSASRRIDALQDDLTTIDRQLASAEEEENQLRRVIAEHQSRVDLLPTRETQLVELTRDYAALQETYSSLLQRREDAELAGKVERGQAGEQYRILSPASLPTQPANRRIRLAVLLSGPIAGLAVGLLLVGFLEMRTATFIREEDVIRVLSLPVLALVPRMDVVVIVVLPLAGLLSLVCT